MKIAVNARMLTEPHTGIGQFCKTVLSELSLKDENNQYVFLVHKEVPESVKKLFGKNVEIKVLAEKKIGTAGMKKVWWEQITVPEYIEKVKADVAYFSYSSNPWTKDWYKKGIKTVVTVHDCIPWLHEAYSRSLLSRMYHRQSRLAVKLADKVVTVSEASKDDIKKICSVPEEKISVIYNDVSEIYKEEPKEKLIAEVLKKFNLKEKGFLLYVGGFDTRKNVQYLLKEYENLETEIPLVLAGGKLYESKLYESFDTEVAGVVKTGFLSEEELAALYSCCLAFVNLSKLEGFNIPLLEAANAGAPLVVSDIKVHREVAGENAIFANILKEGGGKEAIQEIFNRETRERMQKEAKICASRYSAKKSASKLKNVLLK